VAALLKKNTVKMPGILSKKIREDLKTVHSGLSDIDKRISEFIQNAESLVWLARDSKLERFQEDGFRRRQELPSRQLVERARGEIEQLQRTLRLLDERNETKEPELLVDVTRGGLFVLRGMQYEVELLLAKYKGGGSEDGWRDHHTELLYQKYLYYFDSEPDASKDGGFVLGLNWVLTQLNIGRAIKIESRTKYVARYLQRRNPDSYWFNKNARFPAP